jgi:hypothetical protein
MGEISMPKERCLCGHIFLVEHDKTDKCLLGCSPGYCATGIPQMDQDTVEQFDEHGIPWL